MGFTLGRAMQQTAPLPDLLVKVILRGCVMVSGRVERGYSTEAMALRGLRVLPGRGCTGLSPDRS